MAPSAPELWCMPFSRRVARAQVAAAHDHMKDKRCELSPFSELLRRVISPRGLERVDWRGRLALPKE